MSRAFVRESDDRPELPIARQASPLPAGSKNYLTSGGAARLREELRKLVESDRPSLVSQADDPDAKRQLLVLDQRIQQLEETVQSAEVVSPQDGPTDVVRFGATVTIRRSDQETDTYRIVGVDEIDLHRSWVSWASPIARAVLNARVGGRVRFKFPSGEEELEIVKIEYESV
jgi:transcription elongation factor GreB